MTEAQANYLEQLIAERDMLDANFSFSHKLLDKEIERVKQCEAPANFTEIHNDKPKKYIEQIIVPIKEYPKFNFVGRLLGPGGNTLKQLSQETGCKYFILGRGCMRSKDEEEKCRTGGDPKYSHLNDDLHVKVEVTAVVSEAHRRLAMATAELKKLLKPADDHDGKDEIRHQQSMAMGYDTGNGWGPRGGRHVPRAMRGGPRAPRRPMRASRPAPQPPRGIAALAEGYGYDGGFGDDFADLTEDYYGEDMAAPYEEDAFNGYAPPPPMKSKPNARRPMRSHPYPRATRASPRGRIRGKAGRPAL